MKKIFLFLILYLFGCNNFGFADRETPTITAYKTSQLIKRGDGRIYSVSLFCFHVVILGGDLALFQNQSGFSAQNTELSNSQNACLAVVIQCFS